MAFPILELEIYRNKYKIAGYILIFKINASHKIKL